MPGLSWRTVDTIDLTSGSEGSALFNSPRFSTGRYMIVPKGALQFPEAGTYRVTVQGSSGSLVSIQVVASQGHR